ncbi:hypothetical protein ABZ614_20550 [Streptomyces sp. NPDC013178]|uniref:hypothetical protein n=1 Tax=Streptomyces sp. NPDC013178 TaxID=3155118 RepID=UPI003407041B
MTELVRHQDERTVGELGCRREQETAVRDWLLLAASDQDQAREEWQKWGIALLSCGELFAAIRIDSDVIHAAAGSHEPNQVKTYLAKALFSGPVFVDQRERRYYALVGASAANRREWRDRRHPGARCLGHGSHLGVPRPELVDPDALFTYWCVPMDGPGTLCDPAAVSQLLSHGRHRLLAQEARNGS